MLRDHLLPPILLTTPWFLIGSVSLGQIYVRRGIMLVQLIFIVTFKKISELRQSIGYNLQLSHVLNELFPHLTIFFWVFCLSGILMRIPQLFQC